jgi:hypothetical protein
VTVHEDNLALAHRYAAAGMAVFPLDSNKRPCCVRPQDIREWPPPDFQIHMVGRGRGASLICQKALNQARRCGSSLDNYDPINFWSIKLWKNQINAFTPLLL